jgi:hypothetical protein
MKVVPQLLSTALTVMTVFGAAGATAFSLTPPGEIEVLRKKIRAVVSLLRQADDVNLAPSTKATDRTKSVGARRRPPSPKGAEAAKSIEEGTKAAPPAQGPESVRRGMEESAPAPVPNRAEANPSVEEPPSAPSARTPELKKPAAGESKTAPAANGTQAAKSGEDQSSPAGESGTATSTMHVPKSTRSEEEAKSVAPADEAASKAMSRSAQSKRQSQAREVAIGTRGGEPSSPSSQLGSSPAPPAQAASPRNTGPRSAGAGGALAPLGKSQVERPDALKACMDTWDKDTHMTLKEWRATCVRTVKAYPPIERAVVDQQGSR